MADLVRMHCLHCGQTFLTGPDAAQCDLCRKEGGLVTPEAALERASQQPAAQAPRPSRPPGGYPVSRHCPSCGGEAFRSVRPDRLVSFGWDRVCKACDTRYTPPTPLWGALGLIGAGLVLLAIAAVLAVFRVMAGDVLMLGCEAFLALLGALALVQGFRALPHDRSADGAPEEDAEDA
jgi:hypothetical protein